MGAYNRRRDVCRRINEFSKFKRNAISAFRESTIVIPRVFRNDRERTLINYDWVDLAGGVGYITYYAGASTATGSAITYFLTRNTFDGQPINLVGTGTSSTDINFDIEFQSPTQIGGDAIINFTQFGGNVSAGTSTITIYHVDVDNNETSLGTKTTVTRAGTVTTPYRECLKIPLTKKHFAIGEILRVNLIFAHTGGNNGFVYFDPASGLTKTDNLGRTVGTDFVCDIPFKIDL